MPTTLDPPTLPRRGRLTGRTSGGMLLPPALPRGGTLGVVGPGSPVKRETFRKGVEALEACGFRVVVGSHVFDRYGHLSGKDAHRAADIHEMFRRDDVDAIICSRGGSGSIRLLPHLDWDLIGANPKPFLGYSDITILELALLKKCGMVSFFAPMVASDFAYDPADHCVELVWRQVCETAAAGELLDPRCETAETLVGGVAEGPCVGGTLSLVVATLGTPYEIDTDGCVFFFEDVYESPARVERYLMQLLLAGKLERASGFLIGNMPWDASEEEISHFLPVFQVYRDLLEPLGKPMLYAYPVGHDPSPMTLPMGVPIRMDADRKSVTVLEAAVA